MSSQPNFGALLGSWWGGGYVDASFANLAASASNLVVQGTNPPYYPVDLFSMYPRFGGASLNVVGALTLGATTMTVPTGMPGLIGLAAGQFITGAGIPDGTTIASVIQAPASLTLSQPSTATGTAAMTVYSSPLVPATALSTFIALASASLNQARWLEFWPQAMNLYCAHLCQLWLTSEGSAVTAQGAALLSGLARGITTSKSVGDVSVGYQALAGDDEYVDLNLTLYGQALIRLCKVVGRGLVLVW
jgi:hypothetical protein